MPNLRTTQTTPPGGYGPEPASERELLRQARAWLQAALPPEWSVEVNRPAGLKTDAILELRHLDAPVIIVRAEIRRSVTPAGVLSFMRTHPIEDTTAGLAGPEVPIIPMLVTRYLSSQVQELLRERGVSYVDATGNIYLMVSDPLVLLSERGATTDPWRGRGRPTTNLKGLPAALMVRALVDFAPPLTVTELAKVAKTSVGAAYRLVDYLTSEGLITREPRGPIRSVDWPQLLRRWSHDAPVFDMNSTQGYLEPRGLSALANKLREQHGRLSYALSGSLAAQPYAPYAEPRVALLYTDEPDALADTIGLRPVDVGANVIVAAPRSPVVFERTTNWHDTTIVAPSQAVADLLGGPGRNPSEGEFLLEWMEENPDAWRRQLDR